MIFDLLIKRLNYVDVKISGWVVDCTGLDLNFLNLLNEKFLDIDMNVKFDDKFESKHETDKL